MADADSSIPQTDPKANYLAYRQEIDEAIRRVLESGWYILGREVEAFEQEFEAFLGVKHVVGVNSGTDALHLALRACGIGPGDAVLTVSHTAVATVAAVEMAGARPILVDIDPTTYTMDPRCLEEAMAHYSRGEAGRLKAVLVVHLYGCPADMDAIGAIARRHGLRLIEDCAQSHGARLAGRLTGTIGDIAAFSFYPTKNLGAIGDAGAVVTDDGELAERVRLLAQYGWRERFISEIAGVNSRLDELQAAILRVKLRHLEADNQRRRRLAAIYDGRLGKSGLILPVAPEASRHVYHQYVIRTPGRDALRAYLKNRRIGTLIHYPAPVHKQPAYRDVLLGSADGLPQTDRVCGEILSLPMHAQLTDTEAERVADEILAWRSDS
jgi:dTDP-4-amino-4,6-dideoxygalactose transaminase